MPDYACCHEHFYDVYLGYYSNRLEDSIKYGKIMKLSNKCLIVNQQVWSNLDIIYVVNKIVKFEWTGMQG